MQQATEEQTKKVDLKLKLVKDLGFLLNLRPIPVTENCTKYLLEQGQSDLVLKDDQQQFDMIYSYTKYDYEGKTITHINCAKTSKLQKAKSDFDIKQLLLSMKVKERAWFNVCDMQIYRRNVDYQSDDQALKDQDDEIQDFGQVQDIPVIQSQSTQAQSQPKQKEVQKTQQFQYIDGLAELRTGFHYQILMERLEYKNSDNFESKIKVIDQKSQEGKALFSSGKYEEAARIYNYLDSITSNLRKYKKNPETGNYTNETFYSQQQYSQLQRQNIKAKINYLRTFFRMLDKTSEEQKQVARKHIEYLLEKQQHNSIVHFMNAKWQLHLRYLDAALESARRSYHMEKIKATYDLILLIQYQIANKHKIKVKVPINQDV